MTMQQPAHVLDGFGRHVDRRRLHLHHPPAGDVDRQGGDVVEVRVRDEPGRRAHEVPRLAAEVEAELQFRHPPVALHGRPRIAFDRQARVPISKVGCVVHRAVRLRSGRVGGILEGTPKSWKGYAAGTPRTEIADRGAAQISLKFRSGAGHTCVRVSPHLPLTS